MTSALPQVSANASLTEQLADILARPVGTGERELAALHVVDWIGAVAAAARTREGEILHRFAGTAPAGPARAIGIGWRDPRVAAFVNAGLSLVLESDSTHRAAKLHPGPVVIAAALAAGQRAAVAGRCFLDAVVRGYEAMVRVGESVGPTHYVQHHSTATCGPFGAAAAAGSIAGLDRSAMVHALGNAGTRTGGVWQTRPEGAMSKPLHVGGAADAGILAVDLAALGLTGPRLVLEGELGIYAATCPDAEPGAIGRPGAADWKISETSLKPWPGCRHVHPSIDAALALRAQLVERGLTAADIVAVEVCTYPQALAFADRAVPTTVHEGMFSLQHAVAAALCDGAVTLQTFQPERLSHRPVADLRAGVDVRAGEPFSSRYPQHWGARVSVRTTAGNFSAQCDDPRGDPESPMAPQEVRAKARNLLAQGGVAADAAEELIAAVLRLPDDLPLASIASLLP